MSRRRLGVVLAAIGVLVAVYAATVVLWRDPATDLYARWKQHELNEELEEALVEQPPIVTPQVVADADADGGEPTEAERRAAEQLAVARAANDLHRKLELGKALGRLTVDRLGLKTVFVQGTRWRQDLSEGPGHYPETSLPGVGRTMAIAGHRTTFGAPFRHIDSLRKGDPITVTMPYATFRYEVFKHEIVDSDDWSIIRDRGFDTLVLSACHPLYSAEQRWIVYARLVRVEPAGGSPYAV
jgi:sortase A